MTCLTLSPPVVAEAVQQSADLVIAHHPLPFKPLSKITSDTLTGSMLLDLISGGVAVYSAHTAFDSAAEGINQTWAQRLGLQSIAPLVEPELASGVGPSLGSGRWGELPEPVFLEQLIAKAAALVGATAPRRVGAAEHSVSRVAVACGSGGSFLAAARRKGCHALITGEATFHSCLEAESSKIGLGLLGHYPSERFAMERLADDLSRLFPNLTIWPSRVEHDPIAPVIA
jgi:dinuclear metal center YbgI/SA1388 family protein